MAALEIATSFGGELKDGFKPVHAWVSDQHIRPSSGWSRMALESEHRVLTSLTGHQWDRLPRRHPVILPRA